MWPDLLPALAGFPQRVCSPLSKAPQPERINIMSEDIQEAESPVRLVIWDLDETFWTGTLSEGGITFKPENRDLVIELARRGILSSICSKNDFETVRRVLIEYDVWQYFVFPSISWEPKGPRVRDLIEAFQLRAPTVLFIDDNSSNRQEVSSYVDGVQIRSHEFIPEMRTSSLFIGKDDSELTRLAQYKVLEKRKIDEVAAGADVDEFLRASNIRVHLEFNVERHLSRAVELINRTNQLNFIKERLSEDTEEAEAELTELLGRYYIQAALVHVEDNYGDHGYCGFYVFHSEERRLLHYCFSCRILGMGVEQWLYAKLNRPWLAISGEVLTDLHDRSRKIDWITQVTEAQPVSLTEASAPADDGRLGYRVVTRGACDLGAITHYFTATFRETVGEYHAFRCGTAFRIDHTELLRQAIDGLSTEAMLVARRLGYLDEDFNTGLFDCSGDRQLAILGLTTDARFALYRHRKQV
jgi:FkbH-like protein